MGHQPLLHGIGAAAPAGGVPRPADSGGVETVGDRRRSLRRAEDQRHALRRIGWIEIVDDPAVGIDLAILFDPAVLADSGRALLGRRLRIPRHAA